MTVKNAVLVWDGVTVEDDVFLGPNVVFTNDLRPRAHVKKGRDRLLPTLVRRGATLGAGVTVVCGTTVGEYAFVAAGSVVTRDVPAKTMVSGNPAQVVGQVCVCGEKAGRGHATGVACGVTSQGGTPIAAGCGGARG